MGAQSKAAVAIKNCPGHIDRITYEFAKRSVPPQSAIVPVRPVPPSAACASACLQVRRNSIRSLGCSPSLKRFWKSWRGSWNGCAKYERLLPAAAWLINPPVCHWLCQCLRRHLSSAVGHYFRIHPTADHGVTNPGLSACASRGGGAWPLRVSSTWFDFASRAPAWRRFVASPPRAARAA